MGEYEYSARGEFCSGKNYGRKKSPCENLKVILQKRKFVVDYSIWGKKVLERVPITGTKKRISHPCGVADVLLAKF